MNVLISNGRYEIYKDGLDTKAQLPTDFYEVGFNEKDGFFLTRHDEININEKIYGEHLSKAEKVLAAFGRSQRNLGVILSGDKGIGKSLCAKQIAILGVENDLPVIVVNKFFPGIAGFLASIDQEVIFLFDEFDKTFGGDGSSRNSMFDPQTEMLTLFDGVSQGKSLFVVTCNSLSGLNDYLVNRPGRFHYHFRFEYPNDDDIKRYILDRGISEENANKVVSFSRKLRLNYDCLRAIAFELETGASFDDAICDLNIINNRGELYTVVAVFENGKIIEKDERIDLFSYDEEKIEFRTDNYNYIGEIRFLGADAQFMSEVSAYVITPDKGDFQQARWLKKAIQEYKDIEAGKLDKRDANNDPDELADAEFVDSLGKFKYAMFKQSFKNELRRAL